MARNKKKGATRSFLLGRIHFQRSRCANVVAKSSKSRDDIVRFNDLNEEAFEDIILSIDHTTKQGKVAFSLVKNCKTAKYREGN